MTEQREILGSWGMGRMERDREKKNENICMRIKKEADQQTNTQKIKSGRAGIRATHTPFISLILPRTQEVAS